MVFKKNYYGQTEPSRIYLCRPDNTILYELNGIEPSTVVYTRVFNNCDTIQFNVYKYVDGELSNGYDLLDEAMYLRVDNIGYFRMQYPQINGDGYTEYKTVSAESCDCELLKKFLVSFEINRGTSTSQELLADGNTYETDEGVKIPKEWIRLYNPDNPQLSLLDLVLEKAPQWTVDANGVDNTLNIYTYEKVDIDDDGNITKTETTELVKRSFEVDSESIYAFLTQEVTNKYECVVSFDILNRKISVKSIDNFGEDSRVFISYRNLAQTVAVNVQSEDSIYTRFNVRGGDDLTLDYVNFGSSYIEDLSYFTKKQYMGDLLIAKYQKWLETIEEKRTDYIAYAKKYATLMEQRDEVNTRVPNDGLETDWKQFTVDELQNTILPKYRTYKQSLYDLYFDTTTNKWMNQGAYQDWLAYGDGDLENDPPEGAERTGIIGAIINTIRYKKKEPPYDQELEDQIDEDLDAWKTQWELYGLIELKNRSKVYEDNIEALAAYQKTWNDLSDEEKQTHTSEVNYNISHAQYEKYVNLNNSCEAAIEERQKEYDDLNSQMTEMLNNMTEIKNAVQKENFVISFTDDELNTLSKYPHKDDYDFTKFTDDELETLSKLYTDSDYQNENILTISTDTTEQIINTQYELLEDAKDELNQEAQPQLSFQLTMDNFYAIDEFQAWHGVFDIGNFIWLSIDENEETFQKLRISQITFNPCVLEDDFQVQFTNMLLKNGGRSDFSVILNNAIQSTQSQINNKISTALDTTAITMPDSLIQALVNSSSFSNALSNGVYNTISANTGTFGEVLSKTINAQQLMAESGLFERVIADDGTYTNVLAINLNANRMSVGTLAVDRLIIRGNKYDEDGNLISKSLMYELNETLDQISQTTIDSDKLDEYYLNGKNIAAHTITADEINVTDLVSLNATIGGNHIGKDSIYSGAKTSATSASRGFYLGSDGQIGIGDENNYMRFYKKTDDDYVLEISANSVTFGKTGSNLEDTVTEINNKVEGMKDEISTLLRIESSRGILFKDNEASTVLSVVIYHGKTRITDSTTMKSTFGSSAYLQWKWQRLDEDSYGIISADDSRFSNDGFSFTLSPDDVDTKVTFMCELIIE